MSTSIDNMSLRLTSGLDLTKDDGAVDLSALTGEEEEEEEFVFAVARLVSVEPLPDLDVDHLSARMVQLWSGSSGPGSVALQRHESGRFICRFCDPADKRRALGRGPWFYRSALVVVGEYDASRIHVLSFCNRLWLGSVWTGYLQCVTPQRWARKIGSTLCQFLHPNSWQLEKEEEMRVLVEMDISRPLVLTARYRLSPTFATNL